MATGETIVWTGRPSQLKNFKVFVVCGLLSVLIAPLFYALWKWLEVRCAVCGVLGVLVVPFFYAFWKWLEVRCFIYELTDQRLKITQGILTKKTDEIELYRVKDTSLVEPFWLRILGKGDVKLLTSDQATPQLTIEAIDDPGRVREQLRAQVEALRDTKRVREIDFE